jgi:hypothetical protein
LTDLFTQTWQALTLKKAENVSRDGDIFEIAHKHKIKIWSVDSKHHNSTNIELLKCLVTDCINRTSEPYIAFAVRQSETAGFAK